MKLLEYIHQVQHISFTKSHTTKAKFPWPCVACFSFVSFLATPGADDSFEIPAKNVKLQRNHGETNTLNVSKISYRTKSHRAVSFFFLQNWRRFAPQISKIPCLIYILAARSAAQTACVFCCFGGCSRRQKVIQTRQRFQKIKQEKLNAKQAHFCVGCN